MKNPIETFEKIEKEREKLKISQLYRQCTMSQLDSIFEVSEKIISNLDEIALNELFEGYSWDIDKLLSDIIEESYRLIISGSKESIKTASFNYLENLTNQLDEILKNISLAYFVGNVLQDFEIAPYHLEWFNLSQIFKHLCIMAARNHSKSYVFSFANPIWKLWQYKGTKYGKEILMITAEHGLAKHFLEMIRTEIQENVILKDRLYPGPKAINWGKEGIVTKNNCSLYVKGSGSALRGLHVDTLIVDDLLTEFDMYNVEIAQQTIDFFNSVLMNILNPGGRITVVGTPMRAEDLYGHLKKSKGWRVFEYPAINPDGSVLYPERFNLQSLLDKKESLGSIVFSREILVRPISNTTSIFPQRALEAALRKNLAMVHNRYSASFMPIIQKIGIGIDLAISGNVGADYFVCCTVAKLLDGKYRILNIFREKNISYNQQLEVVKRLNNNFSPEVIMVETNQYQEAFYQMLIDAGLTQTQGRKTTAQNKYSVDFGLIGLSTLFEKLKIEIPYDENDGYTYNLSSLLMNELSSITFTNNKIEGVGAHDDMVMALLFAIVALNTTKDGITLSFLDNAN